MNIGDVVLINDRYSYDSRFYKRIGTIDEFVPNTNLVLIKFKTLKYKFTLCFQKDLLEVLIPM